MQLRLFILCVCSILATLQHTVAEPAYITLKPLVDIVEFDVKAVTDKRPINVPIITWGGDIATIHANGGNSLTSKGSLVDQHGLKLKLERKDNFTSQLKEYIEGDTPYLRCTMGMCSQALELLSKDPRTKPVVIYQMTWSNGGDALVAKKGIMTVKHLKGKTIALQAYGPHLDFLTALLKQAKLSIDDVNLRWLPDLTLSDNSPGEAFKSDENIDAAFVLVPDALELTSNRTIGTGKRGSVKGARMITSTFFANRVIADVYAVRADYFEQNRDEVKYFVHSLIKAESEIREIMQNYGAEQRLELLTQAADMLFETKDAILDVENLYTDAEFVGLDGNIKFFSDHAYPHSLTIISDDIQEGLTQVGILSKNIFLSGANWNYKNLKN